MEKNTGYIITEQNAAVIANISGKEMKTLLANKGWVAIYQEDPYPVWRLLPRNAAEQIKDFTYIDSPLNGLPTRSEKDIRAEWSEVNKAYSEKVESLRKELERRKLLDSETSQEKQPL